MVCVLEVELELLEELVLLAFETAYCESIDELVLSVVVVMVYPLAY
jgi:hypothetical protein